MAVVLAVEDGRDILGPPFVRPLFFLSFGITTEREHLGWRLTKQAVGGQSVHHVTQHRIVDAITNEADGVITEKLADEARRPALGEVG